MSRMRNGHPVRLSHEQICGCGLDLSKLKHETQKKLAKAHRAAKGAQIQLDLDEIAGQGIFGKKFDKLLKKAGIKKAARLNKAKQKTIF